MVTDLVYFCVVCFFFFKQKTAYDMRISDWSSDVCSSDLIVLYQKDFGGDENFHILAVNARTGTAHDLTPYPDVRAGIEDDLPDDPDHVLISHNQRDPQVFDVYRVNVHTGAAALVAQNPGNVVGWQTDHAGKVRAARSEEGLDTTLLYRDDEATPFRPLTTTD